MADCFHNSHELNLLPGQGDLDFGAMFEGIEAAGCEGYDMNAFGTTDDMRAARDDLVASARSRCRSRSTSLSIAGYEIRLFPE